MVEELPIERLATMAPDLDDLARQALSPNAFYGPRVLLPALRCLASGRVRVLGWFDENGRLDAILPVERRAIWRGLPLPHWAAWKHPYAYLSTPLLRRGRTAAVVAGLRRWLATGARRRGFLHLPVELADGPFLRALRQPDGGGLVVQPLSEHARALLQSPLSAEAYTKARLNRRRRKDHRRQLRQLGGLGAVSFHHHTEPAALRARLADFLALEAAGWKGDEGSALSQSPRSRRYMDELFAGFAPGDAELLELRLDDRPVAMKLNLHAAPGSFAFKIAYDQSLSRYSPGVLLELRNIEAVLDRPDGPAWMDSCADPDHPMIDHLWSERRRIACLNVAADTPGARLALGLAAQAGVATTALRGRWAALPSETQQRIRRLRNRLRR